MPSRISIHAPHARSDCTFIATSCSHLISIHAPHARSDCLPWPIMFPGHISIHAPHARSDVAKYGIASRPFDYFNPRSSCEERPKEMWKEDFEALFQSTLLMRGATFGQVDNLVDAGHFNPRSSCEERLEGMHNNRRTEDFNPRSSCEERLRNKWQIVDDAIFQSTLLMRGATTKSILRQSRISYFNPRSSCEERQQMKHSRKLKRHFNPRSSFEERPVFAL